MGTACSLRLFLTACVCQLGESSTHDNAKKMSVGFQKRRFTSLELDLIVQFNPLSAY